MVTPKRPEPFSEVMVTELSRLIKDNILSCLQHNGILLWIKSSE